MEGTPPEVGRECVIAHRVVHAGGAFEAVIGVANALGKTVVAEGVDSDRKRQKLVELGCRVGQGYLFSVPIPADEVLEWCARLDESSVIEKLVAQNG